MYNAAEIGFSKVHKPHAEHGFTSLRAEESGESYHRKEEGLTDPWYMGLHWALVSPSTWSFYKLECQNHWREKNFMVYSSRHLQKDGLTMRSFSSVFFKCAEWATCTPNNLWWTWFTFVHRINKGQYSSSLFAITLHEHVKCVCMSTSNAFTRHAPTACYYTISMLLTVRHRAGRQIQWTRMHNVHFYREHSLILAQCRKWLNTSHNATNHHIPSPFRGLTHSNLSDVCCLGFFAISSGLEPCSDCGRLPGIVTGLCPSLAVSCFYDHFCFHLLSSCQLSVLHYFIPAACILSLPWLCMVLVMTTHHHSPVLLWMTLTYLPEEWG